MIIQVEDNNNLGRIVNHNTPYLLQRKDGVYTDPETGIQLGFDNRFMGKGEGQQCHGWGVYLSVADIRAYGNFHKRGVRIKEEIFDANFIAYGTIKKVPLRATKDEIKAYKLALLAGNIASHFDLIDCKPKDVADYINELIKQSETKISDKESQKPTPMLAKEIESEKEKLNNLKFLIKRIIIKGTRHHYGVKIPDWNGSNYLQESDKVTPKQIKMICAVVDKDIAKKISSTKWDCGRHLYLYLTDAYGSDEKASKILNKAGFVGIHYYGGRDGECYVIFDDKDAVIVNHELYGLGGVSNQDMQNREFAIVSKARHLIGSYHGGMNHLGETLMSSDLESCYNEICDLYEKQSTIRPKDMKAVSLQQYSTPCPIAFLMGQFVKLTPYGQSQSFYEPTAGNGMLTIGLPPRKTVVNELDEVRLKNLKKLGGYMAILNEDATQYCPSSGFSGVIMNPPFGALNKEDYITRKGIVGKREVEYTFERLDYKIAVSALEAMRDSGRAAIIVGGKLAAKYQDDYSLSYWNNGRLFGQYRDFIAYLHRQYNIVDIIYISGYLYRKQGTTFPIVLILIDGRTPWNSEPTHIWHKFDAKTDLQIESFSDLYLRMYQHLKPESRHLLLKESELIINQNIHAQ